MRFPRSTFLMATALVLSACGGDNGTGPGPSGGDQITAAQRAQITQLMSNPDVIEALVGGAGESGMGAFALPLLAGNLGGVGSVTLGSSGQGGPPAGSYSAFGAQIDITLRAGVLGGEPVRLVWSGFVAVDNLSSPHTVVTAGVVDLNASSLPSSIPATAIGDDDSDRVGFGSWVDLTQPNGTGYFATSGSVGVSSASFGSSAACPFSPGTVTVTSCATSVGTMSGNFGFVASPLGGGAATTVLNTSLSVPAVRLAIEMGLP